LTVDDNRYILSSLLHITPLESLSMNEDSFLDSYMESYIGGWTGDEEQYDEDPDCSYEAAAEESMDWDDDTPGDDDSDYPDEVVQPDDWIMDDGDF